MKLTNMLPNMVSRKVGRATLITKKNSPHIFFGLGLAGVVTSTVLACKATLKLDKTLDEIKREKDDLLQLKNPTNMYGADETSYSEREYYRDLGYVYTKSALKLGRLYAPSIVVGTVGIAALTGSHVQMTRRNTALTVTLAAVSRAYDEYRLRVAEVVGEDKELDLYRGIHDEKVMIDGKKELVKVIDPNGFSPYARLFDESNPNWKPNAEMNRITIQAQQNYFNHRLRAYGHVFLNEVFDALGFERSQAGAIVGWLCNGDGDCYVDFGIFEAYNAQFINNQERSVWLDFNVDGIIYDKI